MTVDENIKPKLNDDIVIEKFSTSSIEQKYLVTHKTKRFEISKSIYSLLQLADGKNNFNDIAEKYSSITGKKYAIKNIQYIFKNILGAKDLLINSKNDINKEKNSVSYLYFRLPLISQKQLKLFTSKFGKFFIPSLFKILLLFSVIFHMLFFIYHNNFDFNNFPKDITSLLIIYSLYFISMLFHELGHSSACNYFGAEHGNIGLGLYLYFPVFYADVTDVWKLPRLQRAVVDFAGIYFQILFVFVLYAIYFFTNQELIIYGILAIETSFVVNLNPFFRFDGYWLFSDLTGIPNLRQRSMEVVSYLFNKLFNKKNLLKPYIFNIGRKEKLFAYPYLIVTSLFFLLVFYRILFYLPNLLIEYPSLALNTFSSIYDNIVIHKWNDAWGNFSAFIFPTIITLMLLFMSYRMGKRISLPIYKNIRNLYLKYFVKK